MGGWLEKTIVGLGFVLMVYAWCGRYILITVLADSRGFLIGVHMEKYIVLIQGNSGKTFHTIDSALKYAANEVYATRATIIRSFDALKDGQLAQWSYGFRSVAVYPEIQG